ncbi:AAA family ATPase [Mariniflexile sp.]|uniref:AAA family ATPase n=1 Tax=Mariniflexile sp. TaxID=1979402 RepID=UPI00404746C7
MKKYITVENQIYEATLILSTDKTNDEFVPVNRKIGSGGDKNHFFVNTNLFEDFGKFFPLILKDKRENKSNRNNITIKNYFSISNILNDLDFINNEIESNYKKEAKIDNDDFSNSIFSIAKEQHLKTNFYIESELGSAGNGIGFKNWNNTYSTTIKLLLLHTTKTKVYLFNKEDEICSYFEFSQEYSIEKTDFSLNLTDKNLIQKIYYGAPGTGKSHKVEEITAIAEKAGRVERITFHPEYDYSSFVGGYKPTMNGENIRYEFVPQAFANIYVKAWNDLKKDYYLVIEEINRGNCAEIFGDIFQLLDRTNDYKITPSKELKEYLATQLSENENIDSEKLLLPPNLNILATMNTSDQSLFPMDSAFKRRWDWEYIPINYEDSENNSSSKYNVKLSDNESFSWLSFIKEVNNMIKLNDNLGMDKCLGNYFIKPELESIDIETFINKAVFYLWNDVFKDEMEEHSIFKNKTTYEDFFPIQSNGINKIKEILEVLNVGTTVKATI